MIKKYLITVIIAFVVTGFAVPYVFNQGRLYHFAEYKLIEAFSLAVQFNEEYSGLEAKNKNPDSTYYLLNYILFFDHLVTSDQSPKETKIGEFLRRLNAVLLPGYELLAYEKKQNFYSNHWQCKLLKNKDKYNIPDPAQLLVRYNQSPYAGKLVINYTAEQADQAWQNLSCDMSLLDEN